MRAGLMKLSLCIACMGAYATPVVADAGIRDRTTNFDESGFRIRWGTTDFDVLHLLLCALGTLILSFVTYKLKCSNDAKNSFRTGLLPYMQEIALEMDGVLAQCNVYLSKCKELLDKGKNGERPETKEALRRCLIRIKHHSDGLRAARKSARYFLWDEDDVADHGLRKLEKVGGRITQFRDRPDEGLKMLEKVDDLRKSIDKLLINAYSRGKQPAWWRIADIERKTSQAQIAFVGNDDDGSVVIVGVDFVVPEEILKRYVMKVCGNPDKPISEKQKIKIYEEMLNALAVYVSFGKSQG